MAQLEINNHLTSMHDYSTSFILFKVPLVNYWSEKEATCYGSLTVETTEVDSKSNYIVLSITLTDTKVSETRLFCLPPCILFSVT